MQHSHVKTHNDGIWISAEREREIIRRCDQALVNSGWQPRFTNKKNYGYPYIYDRNNQVLHCRFVDSVFLEQPSAFSECDYIITDNLLFRPCRAKLLMPVPDFWSIWQFDPVFVNREPTKAFNCFMHRARGDRSMFFYELIRRKLLPYGLVSYNCDLSEYEQQYQDINREDFCEEHKQGKSLIPYNTVETNGSLEQCIIDSRVSLIIETYTSDNHVVFSEKIFRALQLPRPWLLSCSPGAVACLRSHGFDVLDDVIDHGYDHVPVHSHRHAQILDQLQTFVDRTYSHEEYQRFAQACTHNQDLLRQWQASWPQRFNQLLTEIGQL